MSDCVQCKCEPLTPSKENCLSLNKANDEKIRDFAIMYRDLQTCNLASEGAKGFYNIWCVLKSIIAQICFVMSLIKEPKEYKAGNNITISDKGEISATIPKPKDVDLSGYVTLAEYNKTKDKLDKIIENLKVSGAWSGNGLVSGRNIATGNINIFGQTPDGNSFIRTNKGKTENDLVGGI